MGSEATNCAVYEGTMAGILRYRVYAYEIIMLRSEGIPEEVKTRTSERYALLQFFTSQRRTVSSIRSNCKPLNVSRIINWYKFTTSFAGRRQEVLMNHAAPSHSPLSRKLCAPVGLNARARSLTRSHP